MPLTSEQKQKNAADKIFYQKMADYHKKESEHYAQKAINAEPLELVCHTAPNPFGGL
jgi:hypothetical protein